jgi:hypothetical protein
MSAYLPEDLLDDLGTVVGQRIKAVRDMIGRPQLSGIATITLPTWALEHEQVVAAPDITPAHIVHIGLAPHDDGDVNHETFLDPIQFTARAGIDQITIIATCSSRTLGDIKLNWSAS